MTPLLMVILPIAPLKCSPKIHYLEKLHILFQQFKLFGKCRQTFLLSFNYQSPAEGRGLVGKIDKWNCGHNACEREQFPVVCLSVCRTTPPSCFDQSSSNFQGMLWGILVMHISKIRLICWEIKYFPYMAIFTKIYPLLSHSSACKSNIRKRWQ